MTPISLQKVLSCTIKGSKCRLKSPQAPELSQTDTSFQVLVLLYRKALNRGAVMPTPQTTGLLDRNVQADAHMFTRHAPITKWTCIADGIIHSLAVPRDCAIPPLDCCQKRTMYHQLHHRSQASSDDSDVPLSRSPARSRCCSSSLGALSPHPRQSKPPGAEPCQLVSHTPAVTRTTDWFIRCQDRVQTQVR